MRQIFLVDKIQLLIHVHISVQIDEAVCRMVVCPVKVEELLVCKLRNMIGIAAALHAVGIIREQRIHDLTLKHIVRRGEGSLHLIVNNTVYSERSFR